MVFILIPEALVSLFGLVELALSHHFQVYPYSDNLCILSSVVYTMYTFVNLWTNALCANELYHVLRKAREISTQFKPFSSKKIIFKILTVYLASCAMTIWYICHISLTDTRIDPTICMPMSHTEVGQIINEEILPVINILLPPLYVLYVAYQVHREKLLPRDISNRFIAMYFFRIACTMSLFSLVITATFMIASDVLIDLSILFISCNGALLSLLTLQKRDIRKALLSTQNAGNSIATMAMTTQSSIDGE